ncbi:MAG: hypothetical protein SGBAC_010469 [Bacillariaceae sp.]
MYGLAFEVIEAWVIDEHGLDTWHATKKKARCNVEDKGFVSRTSYEYKLFVKLIKSLSLYLEKPADKIFRSFGNYVVGYLFASEYGSILRSQGTTLQQWLASFNTAIDHFQRSFPKGANQSSPVFWCEDFKEENGSIMLHHYNPRGNAFVPMVVGFVEELASYHFEIEIKMELIALQNSGDSKYSTWMIKAADPTDSWKITPSVPKASTNMDRLLGLAENDLPIVACPFVENAANLSAKTHPTTEPTANVGSNQALTVHRLRQVFPFHVVVDRDFTVLQVGSKLPLILRTKYSELCGTHMNELFEVLPPQMSFGWDWNVLDKLWDQTFLLKPITEAMRSAHQNSDILFNASLLTLSTQLVMFSLRPNVKEIEHLKERGLTLSDMSNVTSERDTVFLGEYVSREAGKILALERLSKALRAEQKLSETLLYNLLPKNVARDLRAGKTVEPKYHENVTLFFSDVEGFTSLCDQIQPWDVIDMMNQLYSVMDFLAKHFELYKVETVGDAYICASGLPESNEQHAEKIANFALAVIECTKHVKSPLTGEAVKLRIGIHTGSCTAGVVGTLTPHYCLFGDMVNFTARHETSGAPGRIHCSNDLHELLKSRSPAGAQQYRFKPRGLVDMKGKGEHLTHWLERGTENNHSANPGSLLTLSNKVRKRISTKKWKMRKYFQKQQPQKSSRSLDASIHSSDRSCFSSVASGGTNSITLNSRSSLNENLEESKAEAQHEAILTYSEELPKYAQEWRELHFDSFLPEDELVTEMFGILLSTLNKCIEKGGRRLKIIKDQLRLYVQAIVDLYTSDSIYHNLRYAAEAMHRAAFLMARRSEVDKKDPWDVFMMVFAIFVRDIHHLDISDDQLEHECDYLVSHYRGKGAYQQRRSLDVALEILEDDFQQLYEEIFLGCPMFRRGVKKLVVASAEIESESKFKGMLERFDTHKEKQSARARTATAQHESDTVLSMILALATMGHYCQSHDLFLYWNQLQLLSQLHCFENDKRSTDPCKTWHKEQTVIFKTTIGPLVARVEKLLPKNSWLQFGFTNNLTLWERDGREWVSSSLIPEARVTAAPWAHNADMISSNLSILETLLAEVGANRGEDGTVGEVDWESLKHNRTPYEEMRLSLDVSRGDNRVRIDPSNHDDLPARVQEELRDFMLAIANGHGRNEFHNFHHASHAAHIADLLLQSIEKESDEDRRIVFAPLVRFAVVLSALVHDVGHAGVPNSRLKVENPELAEKYSNKSIAEQNAIDVTWRIFMSENFQNLREFMFGSSLADCKRLRELMVNGIMATDFENPVLKALRKRRWLKAPTCRFTKSTLIMEHILQISTVSHSVQAWDIFLEWNERQFWEAYLAFFDQRSSKDPSESWYKDQLKYFDNCVLPLTETGTEAGIWDILSDQLFQQATRNRLKWELEGQGICDSLIQKTKARFSKPSDATATTATESILTSTIVEQIESLSKVIKRYERKAETACGNLITVAYNDHSTQATKGLRNQSWSEIHMHFKQQGWYRVHSKTLDDDYDMPQMNPRPSKDAVIHDC